MSGFTGVSCTVNSNNVTATINSLSGSNLTSNGVFWISSIKNAFYIDPTMSLTNLTIVDSSMRSVNNYPDISNMKISTTTPAVLINTSLN